MKKALSLILALVLCLSLCACGGNNAETVEGTDPVETTTEPVEGTDPVETTTEPQKEITAESVAGSYKTTMWFLDETITLNSNTTYTSSNGSKGTFSVTPSGIITLDPVDSSSANRSFQYTENSFFDYKDWLFEEDQEFGLAFSPDENGLTEQIFDDCLINGKMPGSKYNWFALNLKKDGSFTLEVGNRGMTSLDVKETYNGSYTYSGSELKLSYEGQEYAMIVSNNGFILFNIFEKVE